MVTVIKLNVVRKMSQNVFKLYISDVLQSLIKQENQLYFTLENAYKNAVPKHINQETEKGIQWNCHTSF